MISETTMRRETTVKRKPSIEPDDGYEFEKDAPNGRTWEDWERERDEYLDRTYPGLFRIEVPKCES